MIIYYFDNVNGSDSNDGLTPDTAWSGLLKINDISSPPGGTQILLEETCHWSYTSITSTRPTLPAATSTKYNPVIIGKYSRTGVSDPDAFPKITWHENIETGDWSWNAVKSCWEATVHASTTFGPVAFVRLGGSWNGSQTEPGISPAALYEYQTDDTNKIYVWTPDGSGGQTPTAYYGSIIVSPNTVGFFSVSSGKGSWVIQDIEFENMGCGIMGYSGTAAEVNLIVRRIKARTVSSVIYLGSDPDGILDARVHDCDIEDFGACAIWAYATSGAGMKSIEIDHNHISDGIHGDAQGAIYIQARSSGCVINIHHNDISNCRHGTANHIQDGVAIYAETGSDNVFVHRNTITDCYRAFHDNSGRKTAWHHNHLIRCNQAMITSDAQNIGTTDHDFYNNTCELSDSNSLPFGDYWGLLSWRAVQNTGVDTTATAIRCRANVFYNTVPDVRAAIRTATTVASTVDYSDNVVYGYPVIAELGASPYTEQTATGSVIADPVLDGNGVPSSTGPAAYSTSIVAPALDYDGRLHNMPRSAGAFEPPR